jgi:3'(2'), 5'-bisphosphate nucleotidase
MQDLTSLAGALMPAVEQAAAAIMRIYGAEFAVVTKADDSPLTQADLESQRIIAAALSALTPGVPVLSEESAEAPWAERRHWTSLWVVDPLDGTREFVKRNGEFTINIALVRDHEPLLGIVAAPAQAITWWGAVGTGAFRRPFGGADTPIRTSAPQTPLRIIGSRSHNSPETDAFCSALRPSVHSGVGSSLKFCRIAEGAADLYPRFGPTSEWDTAAGQALVEAAGGQVTRPDGRRLLYNCRESLRNGDFLVFNDPSVLTPRA